ncbi:EAL domain-containing protein [Cognatiluteimonas weifangensis]|nr:EAL domain-containing protein [Luteimonas weifangensis]
MDEARGSRLSLAARLREAALVTAVYALTALLALYASPALGGDTMLWIGNGVLLGWMLHRVDRHVLWWLLPCALVDGGARLLFDATPPLAAGLALVDTLEVALAWAVLRRWHAGGGALDEAAVAALLGVGVLAPLAAALPAALALQQFGGLPLREALLAWWPGHALGLLAVTPVVAVWRSADRAALPRAFWGFLAVVLAVPAVALSGMTPVLVALLLLLAAGRVGVFGSAALGTCAVAATMGWAALSADVAIAGLPAGVPPALALGLALALLALAPLLVAVLVAQRAAARTQAQLAGQRFAVVAEHAPGLLAQLDRDLRYRYANDNFLQWHGLTAAQVLGRSVHESLAPDVAARLASRMRRALAGQPQQFDLPMPDGRQLQTRLQPQFGGDGSVDGFYLVAEDVSWRGQGERRFEALLTAAEPMLLLEASGRIAQANAAATQLLGETADALLQRPFAELLGEASRDALQATLERLRAAPAESAQETLAVWTRPHDGAAAAGQPLELRLAPLPGNDGTLAASLRDLGTQLQLEQALQHEQALARAVLATIGDAVIACDAGRRIVLLNPIAEELSGWSRAEALGRPLEEVVRLCAQESGEALRSPLLLALESNRAVGLQPDSALLRRDGSRRPVESAAAPVQDDDGNALGAVMVFHDVSETRAMAMKMSHLAQHDYLTDLPNRVLLHDRLSQALAAAERGAKGALLFVDLDFFKHINDTLGHQAGDKVLQEVARRLVEAVRADDTVSRQGGDEFVLLLVRLADPRDAARVAEKLILAIEQPFHVEGQVLHISASVGIALFPQDARDIKTLMKQADTALYHAKEAGRGRYSYFTGIMSERADQRMRTEHDLRFALANEDFFLAYQPKVRLPEGRITGMEALVRWRRSDTGEVVPPGEFIPVAEETGLIVALDEWVMHEACRQNRAWQDAGLPQVPVSVNVSLARFDPERLIAHVRKTLADTGMAPQWLEIEFTESQMFTHLERAQELIAQLKALGVQVAVDDFGTGYSSLAYLVRYKFDALKIDRSFVQGLPDDPKHSAIVQAIVGMARALDYRVIAEGVETCAQADALQRHGCHEMQGFLHGRPVAAAEFAALLQRGSVAATTAARSSREA